MKNLSELWGSNDWMMIFFTLKKFSLEYQLLSLNGETYIYTTLSNLDDVYSRGQIKTRV